MMVTINPLTMMPMDHCRGAVLMPEQVFNKISPDSIRTRGYYNKINRVRGLERGPGAALLAAP